MKRKIVLMMVLVMLAMCNVCVADDPNSMATPTAQTPITKSFEKVEGILTLKLFCGELAEEICNDPRFNKQLKDLYRWITAKIANERISALLELHYGETQETIDAQLAAKRATK